MPVLLNRALTASSSWKPLSGGISVQNIPHGSVYPARFAGYITLKIMDLSPVVAWSVPLFGLFLAGMFGRSRAKSGATSIWGAAFFVALVLGFVLMFVQVALHSACVEIKACMYRGDGNMSYWFQSFFAIPLYWLVSGSVWQMKQ